MNTPRVTRLALGGLCALLGLGMLSCQDRDFGLTIRQVQPIDLDTCEVELDESIFQSAGSVDMALRTNYFINVRIENNLLGITEVSRPAFFNRAVEKVTQPPPSNFSGLPRLLKRSKGRRGSHSPQPTTR